MFKGDILKTEVIMKREIFGKEISQKSKSEFFSATDLVRAGNIWRISEGLEPFNMTKWFQQKGTIEFIEALNSAYGKIKISGRGRGSHTWIHPFLFIDMALAISPSLKIEVYKWLYDSLLKYRNDSGDSYKKMTGALFINSKNKSNYKNNLRGFANEIKVSCNVTEWEKATESQLKLRDRIHENIALLCDLVPNNDAVRIGIKKALEGFNNVK
jgi:hypothetical protein